MDSRDIILTLQYCLETFEQTCQCGRCDPCTQGQTDIRRAISSLEEMDQQIVPNQYSYVLSRDSAQARFIDRIALLRFVRDCLPPHCVIGDDATLPEIAAFAGRNEWSLTELQSVPPTVAGC